jgi:AcrR family transcriptional regulator
MAVQPAIPARRIRSSSRGRARRTQVSELQSGRVIVAVIDVVAEVGFAQSTVARIIERANVSRKTFYDLFADREDAFLAAIEQETAQALRLARAAYDEQKSWRAGVRVGLERLLWLMDDQPAIARLCVVDALTGGPRLLRFRADLLERLTHVIDRGRQSARAYDPPAITAELVTGGILSLLHTRICHEPDQPLSDLVGPLMNMIVLPYLGPGVARRELTKGPRGTTPTEKRLKSDTDPLKGLGMRLTYRTVRALMVIGENPGASNCQVARGAGVTDQGQISKLLSRLAGLGLINNVGAGQPKGLPNAWHLTERGAQLEKLARPR